MGDGYGSWVLDDRRFLTSEQVGRLRRHVRGRVERAGFRVRLPWQEWFFIELALETGLRVAEMASLKCSDLVLDVERPGVFVRRGKGGRSRFVRIREQFVRECEDYLNWKQAVGEPAGSEDPVFRSSVTGEHMTVRALQKVFERVCKRVQVADHSIHHCRHTYASSLLRASKFNLRLVQQQLGHSSLTTTEVYLHLESKDLEAVERLYA